MSAALPHPLRALRARDFRIYFAGQLVSVAGTWMQQIAMAWLAYRLTGSALVLGLLGFASQIPILLFAPLGGVWSDRVDRRRLMMVTQVLAMLQALMLAVLAWQGWATPALLIVLAFVLNPGHTRVNELTPELARIDVDQLRDHFHQIVLAAPEAGAGAGATFGSPAW